MKNLTMRAHMLHSLAIFCTLSLLALASSAAFAAGTGMKTGSSAMPAKPSPAEKAFIRDVTGRLQAKFAASQSAVSAGFYRTTRLEPDGTIIYFNNKWDPTKYGPNFLWYDRNGKLVGLDYQYLVSAYPKRPTAYPVAGDRWTTIDPHIHFAYRLQDGTIVRRGARWLAGIEDLTVTEKQLRAAKLIPANAKFLWSYVHPKSWDLGFWLVPNPNGAFADLNPNVKP